MQYFEWNVPNDGRFWRKLKKDALHLNRMGITAVWIPPACKAISAKDVGYGIYDLFDLGEFYQKRSLRTKYGTKAELKRAIATLHKYNISVYFDAVMNHKAGADYTEEFVVKEVDPTNRNHFISEAYTIGGWTGFYFGGRNNQYSDFKWNKNHFTGVDYNVKNGKKAIYLIQEDNKKWSDHVDRENGNYDYLMYANIDYKNTQVVEHMKDWGIWIAKELKLNGMRLDAVKHIDSNFAREFTSAIRSEKGRNFYFVGEYWKNDIESLVKYVEDTKGQIDLFDVPLHYNLHEASEMEDNYDLRNLFNNTLVKVYPELAVTFVENHDSQIGSALESYVRDWFKPSAYGLILLMKDGYPCVFYGDYYSMGYYKSHHKHVIDVLLKTRQLYAHGEQIDYFDDPSIVGFVRLGEENHPNSGLAFLISNQQDEYKRMYVGKNRAGEVWQEIAGNIKETVVIDSDGNGNFSVKGKKLAVWVQKKQRSKKY